MEKVASVTKYKNREQIVKWIGRLPQKYPIQTINNFLLIVRYGNFVLWTDKYGLKIL